MIPRMVDECVQVIKGFGILKKCAARLNVAKGTLDATIGGKIVQVCHEPAMRLERCLACVSAWIAWPGRARCRA